MRSRQAGWVLVLVFAALGALLVVSLQTARGDVVQWLVQDGGNGHFYEPVTTAPPGVSWSVAKAAAESAGGYLVTITSAQESAFVFSLVTDPKYWVSGGGNVFGLWLGGYQGENSPEPNGGWRWVSGEPWIFTAWAAGEPNNQGGNENVLSYMGKGIAAPTWNDGVDVQPTNPASPGYIIEYIPEPATLSLLALGVAALMARRKKN